MKSELEPLKTLLSQMTNLRLALIYGSFARQKVRPDSDIDIAIASNQQLNETELRGILSDVENLTDRKIDLIDLHAAHAPLIQEIFHNPIWILKDNKVYYQILMRSIYEAEDFLPIKNRILESRVRKFIK